MEILHSKIIGQGKPLFIFHGLFGQSDNWGTLGRLWSQYFQVHLIDLRNHGRSFHSHVMTYPAMTQDILNYMHAHQIDKATLLGHSMGGKAVMQFAIAQPDKVEKLIVADIAPKYYPPHHNAILKGLNSVDIPNIKSRKEAEETLKQYIDQVGVRQFLLKNLHWNEQKILNWRFNLESLTKNYNNIISAEFSKGDFQGPTLFLGGENSKYIQEEDHVLIQQFFPNAQIKTVSKSGHWLHAENPKEFTAYIQEFLKLN